LSETLVWLGYLLGGAIAFAAVYRQDWRIVPATVVGGAVSLAVWALSFIAADSDERPAWLEVELALNGSLSVIFAAAGAGLGAYLRHRHSG